MKRPGLLASMLLICFTALVASIALTVILFSLVGRTVYGKVLANGMRPQARMLSEATVKLLNGSISEDNYHFMLRSNETVVVVLDEKKEPFAFSEPKHNEVPMDKPEGAPPHQEDDRPDGEGKSGDKFNNYIDLCKGIYDEAVNAEPYSEYSQIDLKHGVIVALPAAEGEKTLGVVFLIKPVNDIVETSKSVLIVLVITSLFAALLMVLPIYLLSRRLTNPVKKLNKVAGEFSSGDYSGRVKPEGTREIAELGETFNGLADNLRENIGALMIERNRLRAVLDGLNEGIIGFNTEGEVTQSNNSALRLLGGTDSDICAVPAFGKIIKAAKEVLSTGESRVDTISCGERKLSISTAAIEEECGAVAGAVALIMDVTEAERLEQTRRDYVANVSHELRTPLASIRGIADMLNDGLVKDEADKQRYYGSILKESIRLSTLINDLLELSRLQSGGVALKLRKLELYELIADAADRCSESASANGMRIDLTVPEGKYYAFSNPDRLEQVMVSLMDNAVKHGTHGGTIEVGMDETHDKWLVYVENPAIVEEKAIPHLFDRFFKADEAHTGDGTGLGLAITEEVLRLMGESITVKYEKALIRFTFTVSKKEAE